MFFAYEPPAQDMVLSGCDIDEKVRSEIYSILT